MRNNRLIVVVASNRLLLSITIITIIIILNGVVYLWDSWRCCVTERTILDCKPVDHRNGSTCLQTYNDPHNELLVCTHLCECVCVWALKYHQQTTIVAVLSRTTEMVALPFTLGLLTVLSFLCCLWSFHYFAFNKQFVPNLVINPIIQPVLEQQKVAQKSKRRGRQMRGGEEWDRRCHLHHSPMTSLIRRVSFLPPPSLTRSLIASPQTIFTFVRTHFCLTFKMYFALSLNTYTQNHTLVSAINHL